MEILANPIAAQVTSICVAGVCGFLAAQVKRMSARDRALYEGMKAVLRRDIMLDYEQYYVHGEPLPIERKREIEECYLAYAALGGNGTAKRMWEKIEGIDPYMIKDKEDE